jgi:aprataxin
MCTGPSSLLAGTDGVVYFDTELVVMRDKYPKARIHLLVLARDPALAAGPSALRRAHVPLLERMVAAG